MFNYKKIIFTFIFAVANLVYASDISYDQQNITPQTWQEVDLSYAHNINGKDYTEQAKLLRPITWLEQYHLDTVGRLVAVHKSDVGIDATVKIVAIKPSTLSFSSQSHQNNHPVIGTFLKYSDDVWSYTFSNGETIEATSNHPFYDVDKKQYIPIGEFQLNGDYLLTDSNIKVQLASESKHNQGVEAVYNFEVYQAHNYYVSQNDDTSGVLVHNPNGADCSGALGHSRTHQSTSSDSFKIPRAKLASKSEVLAFDLDNTLWQGNPNDELVQPINQELWDNIKKMHKNGAQIIVATAGPWNKEFIQGIFKEVGGVDLELTDIYNSTDGITHGYKGDWLSRKFIEEKGYPASKITLFDDYRENIDNTLALRMKAEHVISRVPFGQTYKYQIPFPKALNYDPQNYY